MNTIITLQVNENMWLSPSQWNVGNEGDHNATTFVIERPSSFEPYICRAIFVTGDGKEYDPLVYDNRIPLTSNLTPTGTLRLRLRFTNVSGEVIGHTNIVDFTVGEGIDATDESVPGFQDSIAQLADSSFAHAENPDDPNHIVYKNINGRKVGEVRIQATGTLKHDELTNRNLPNQHQASAIAFEDGDNFQDKYNRGELTGPVGNDGLSAYEIALQNGFTGTPTEWLESLIGEDGLSAYELAVEQGFIGTIEEWLKSLVGPQGEPAAVLYVGTEENPIIASELPVGFCGLSGVIKSNPGGALYTMSGIIYGTVSRGLQTYFNALHEGSWSRYLFYLSGTTDAVYASVSLGNITSLNTAQTITGLKTFNPLPQSPATPQLDAELTPKRYVDGEIAELRTDITSLQAEATAKWETLNRTEAKSLSNETAIAVLLARIEALEAQ